MRFAIPSAVRYVLSGIQFTEMSVNLLNCNGVARAVNSLWAGLDNN